MYQYKTHAFPLILKTSYVHGRVLLHFYVRFFKSYFVSHVAQGKLWKFLFAAQRKLVNKLPRTPQYGYGMSSRHNLSLRVSSVFFYTCLSYSNL